VLRLAVQPGRPGRIDDLFSVTCNIMVSHLLDQKPFPSTTLLPSGSADVSGDRALDGDEVWAPPADGSAVVCLQRKV
jgi:hypothetical protein